MLVRRAEMLDIECIVRGYLAGSAFKEYQREGTVHGMPMPAGLLPRRGAARADLHPLDQGHRGPRPEHRHGRGHRPRGQGGGRGRRRAVPGRLRPGRGPGRGAGHRDLRHQVRAGLIDGQLSLCDEVLTPDSSRFWPADDCAPGTNPPSFDKQPLRDWLEAQPWDKQPPPAGAPGRDRRGHLHPLRRRLRAGLRAVAGRLVRCLTWPTPDSSRSRSRCSCATASPIPRGPPSSGRCPPSASTVSPPCGPASRSASTWPAADDADALAQATVVADRLLANPVIEESE